MNQFIAEKIDSDLKLLSYQCDEFVNKKPAIREYFDFCRQYYFFLRILKSQNWKNDRVNTIIQKFPALEIPTLTHTPIIVFLIFVLIGSILHSLLFVVFFIILPLSFLTILMQQSILKNNRKKIIQIIHVCSELRSTIHLNK